MKNLPDSLKQLEDALEQERERAMGERPPRLWGFDVNTLIEVRSWLEMYGMVGQPTPEKVREVFGTLTPIVTGNSGALRGPRVNPWFRCGLRRVNLLHVVCYEPNGASILIWMDNSNCVSWYAPGGDGGETLEEQVAKQIKELDAFFAAIVT